MFQKDNLLMVKRINTKKKEKSWCSCIGYFILIFFSFIFITVWLLLLPALQLHVPGVRLFFFLTIIELLLLKFAHLYASAL